MLDAIRTGEDGLSSTKHGYLLVVTAAGLWGVSGTIARSMFISYAASAMDLVGIRITVAAVLLCSWLIFRQPSFLKLPRRDWGAMVLFSLLGIAALQFTFLFAVERTNVATASFLQYQAPVLVALYGVLTRTEQVTARVWLHLALAASGTVLLVTGSATGLKLDWLGVTSGVLAAGLTAFYSIYAANRLGHMSSSPLLGWGLLIGAIGWSVISPPWQWPTIGLPLTAWVTMAFVAVLGTVLPYQLYFTALRKIPSAHVVLTATLEPVVAAVTAFLFLGEQLTFRQFGGCVLILAAIVSLHYTARSGRKSWTASS